MGKLFGNKSVTVGTPSAELDTHRHQPNGDSVIAVQRLQWEYKEEGRRKNRLSTLCGLMAWVGGFLLFLGVFVIVGWNIENKWIALIPSFLAWGAWILLWGKIDPYGGG